MILMPDQLVPVAVHMALFEYELLQQQGPNKLACVPHTAYSTVVS